MRHRLVLVVMALIALCPVQPAFAQGTSGTLPDPISSSDIDAWADWLDMTAQQRLAVDTPHAAYREKFQTLREGDIEAFLETYRQLRSSFMRMPDRGEIEKTLDELDRLLTRIKVLDSQFFAEVETTLTESQILLMPRVRQDRERQRYRGNLMQMVGALNRGVSVDLPAQIRELDLDPGERELVDMQMVSYERRLTSKIRDVSDQAATMILDILDVMEENGLTGGQNTDFEAMRKGFEAVQERWGELSEDVTKSSFDITDMNRQTVRSLRNLVRDEPARELYLDYMRLAYREARSRGTVDQHFERAAQTDLTQSQKEEIAALRGSFDQSRRSHMNRIADLVDDRRKNSSPFNGFRRRNNTDDWTADIEASRLALGELDTRTTERLEQILGTALASADEEDSESPQGGRRVPARGALAARSMAAPGPVSLSTGSAAGMPRDPYTPSAIGPRELAQYAERIGLDEIQIELLDALHTDYLSGYDELEQSMIDPLDTQQRDLWTDTENVSMSEIGAFYKGRREVIGAINELDRGFFDDLSAGVLERDQDRALDAIRLRRELDVYRRDPASAMAGMGRGGRGPRNASRFLGTNSAEPSIDLGELLVDLELPGDVTASLDPVLFEYSRTSLEHLRNRYETSIRSQEETARAMLAARDGGGRGGFNSESWAVVREQRDAINKANATMIELNRATLDAIADQLPPDAARSLRRSYDRICFPRVFDDPGGLDSRLGRVQELASLSPDQRMSTQEIASEYFAAYESISNRMVELERIEGSRWDEDETRRRAADERQNRLEQLRFERSELNAATGRRLQSILTETQLDQIGGLPSRDE